MLFKVSESWEVPLFLSPLLPAHKADSTIPENIKRGDNAKVTKESLHEENIAIINPIINELMDWQITPK